MNSQLWLDWCAVTGRDPNHLDADTVELFARQASPPKREVERLARIVAGQPGWQVGDPHVAPAWPAQLELGHVLESLLTLSGSGTWKDRARLWRNSFALVLLAPLEQGGLGLSRSAARDLTPERLSDLRVNIGVSDDVGQCQACVTSRWLYVASLYAARQKVSVRDKLLTYQPSAQHLCEVTDPSSRWTQLPRLLFMIDRHGSGEFDVPFALSSLSEIVVHLPDLVEIAEEADELPFDEERGFEWFAPPTLERSPDKAEMSDGERDAIYEESDEVNRRIKEMLDDTESWTKRLGLK